MIKFLTIPYPLVFGVDVSVMIAIDNETFPLLIPPINLAIIKKSKLLDKAQKKYDKAIPT